MRVSGACPSSMGCFCANVDGAWINLPAIRMIPSSSRNGSREDNELDLGNPLLARNTSISVAYNDDCINLIQKVLASVNNSEVYSNPVRRSCRLANFTNHKINAVTLINLLYSE